MLACEFGGKYIRDTSREVGVPQKIENRLMENPSSYQSN
jgi:hypothetical protein